MEQLSTSPNRRQVLKSSVAVIATTGVTATAAEASTPPKEELQHILHDMRNPDEDKVRTCAHKYAVAFADRIEQATGLAPKEAPNPDAEIFAIRKELDQITARFLEINEEDNPVEYNKLDNREVALINALIDTPAQTKKGMAAKLELVLEDALGPNRGLASQICVALARDCGLEVGS